MTNTVKVKRTNLDQLRTEKAILELKDFFSETISRKLCLSKINAPLVVTSGTGINDDLNGVERPVRFIAKSFPDQKLEIVQSLAKWKRLMLAELNIPEYEGIITDMKALRPDEIIGSMHSIFVDQWDWEQRLNKKDRTLDYLKRVVNEIYQSIKETEAYIVGQYSELKAFLPDEITFIHSEDLQYRYPKLTPKERENIVAKDYGAVFIIGIGHELQDGVPHDLRAPDYDDWSAKTLERYKGLNGDIIVWNPLLKQAFEISSMGIRVDKDSLIKQLKITGCESRKELLFHKKLLNEELPFSIGGGIGQSRLAMLILRKNNISEVQAKI